MTSQKPAAATESGTQGLWAALSSRKANPVYGLTTVAALLFTFYIWWTGRETRELHFLVNPAKTIVVSADSASRLSVLYDGRPIRGPITSVQVAFWNAGKRSIRADDVLEPIRLQLGDSARVLEASVLRMSRPVVRASLDTAGAGRGTVGLFWRILESDDGGVVQVTYLGGPRTSVGATGTVEGQRRVAVVAPESGAPWVPHRQKGVLVSAAVLSLAMTIGGGFFVYLAMGFAKRWDRVFLMALGASMIALGIFLAREGVRQYYGVPPFRF